eukprot:SAG22_NODE_284_length_13033_cov_21.541828_15_plen_104_part_00
MSHGAGKKGEPTPMDEQLQGTIVPLANPEHHRMFVELGMAKAKPLDRQVEKFVELFPSGSVHADNMPCFKFRKGSDLEKLLQHWPVRAVPMRACRIEFSTISS